MIQVWERIRERISEGRPFEVCREPAGSYSSYVSSKCIVPQKLCLSIGFGCITLEFFDLFRPSEGSSLASTVGTACPINSTCGPGPSCVAGSLRVDNGRSSSYWNVAGHACRGIIQDSHQNLEHSKYSQVISEPLRSCNSSSRYVTDNCRVVGRLPVKARGHPTP